LKLLAVSLLTVTTLAGCSSPTPLPTMDPEPDPTQYVADCDPLMGTALTCALPWPSSQFLVADPSRKTGYHLEFGQTTLPGGAMGVHIRPEPYRKLDGYGIGTPIIVLFPNLDVSGLATEDHVERSLAPDAAILLFEDSGGTVKRIPYFVELDATAFDPGQQVLYVRPGVILKEASRYLVAFRNLRNTSGMPVAPSRPFARLRDGKTADVAQLQQRQARFDKVFTTLEAQGVPRASLTLAWDFVTASSESLHGDLLHMRDDGLQRVGSQGPPLTITKVTEYVPAADGSGRPVDANIAVDLEGTFEVPSYLAPWTVGSFTGDQLHRDGKGLVTANGTRTPRFWVRIPYSAIDGKSTPHGLVLYGHGLLGAGDQVRGSFNSQMANQANLIFFAANMTGMAEEDDTTVPKLIGDLSRFPHLADRLHQGLVEWVLLCRSMREQLESLPQLTKWKLKVNRNELFYSGISQGGIFGASFVAISPDVNRGHLGVPGNNYSLLLQRSTDFQQFFVLLSGSYGWPPDQAVALSVMQLLWDATDPVSHYRHLSAEPYPGNAPKQVLLGPARGDYQVAVVSNEVLARSDLGVGLMAHYDSERKVFGTTEQPYPHTGSGVVLWHFGNAWPPPGNLPPMDPAGDPHGKPRRADANSQQMVHFFRTGEIIDVCNGLPCGPGKTP
jgi:hypothetical protein